jgi:AraC family transcriptional regulator, positive regulator of tynA and feaB
MRSSVLDASIDLIFSCFRPLSQNFISTPRMTKLLAEAKSEIVRRVGWGELRPRDVAEALGISVRYLHKIFAASGTTFSVHLTEERLERARLALANPRLRQQTLTEIAHHFGFYDLSHFNRLFSRRYGVRPAIYRSQA